MNALYGMLVVFGPLTFVLILQHRRAALAQVIADAVTENRRLEAVIAEQAEVIRKLQLSLYKASADMAADVVQQLAEVVKS